MWTRLNTFAAIALLCTCCTAILGEELKENPLQKSEGNREEKFLSLFSVVRFSNAACTGSNGYNGTCMTSVECSSAGGISAGSCASGFGVCCTITITTCQTTTNRNCTYWQNPGYSSTYTTAGQCQVFIKKCSSNICQIRLDFYAFSIAQPSTEGICATDLFTVTGSSNNVPLICGDNTGQHMYLDMTPGTDTFSLAMVTTGTTTSRTWNIKISQIPCDTTLNAPDQCLQWFTSPTGTISSFNYANVATSMSTFRQLSNQDYTICLRMNQGFCGVAYTVCPDTLNSPSAAFSISEAQTSTSASPSLVDTTCLYDWLQIPCASNKMNSATQTSTGTTPVSCVSKICGGYFASQAVTATTTSTTVYSYSKPFELRFHSDSLEKSSAPAPETGNLGFCLNYVQQPCVNSG